MFALLDSLGSLPCHSSLLRPILSSWATVYRTPALCCHSGCQHHSLYLQRLIVLVSLGS